MSRFIFIHDFFQDGRLDVLAEIRVMQVCGQWTKEKRAAWTKQAITYYQRSKRDYPLGSSYYAGRIAALKSAITANYPTLNPECNGKTIFLSIGDEKKILCLECGDDASWKCHPDGNFHLSFYLCDRCKQEQVRTQEALTTFSWDHDRHELLPLPLKESEMELVKVTFPLGALFACNLSNILWPTSHMAMLMELGIVLLIRWQSINIARFLLFLVKSTEKKNQ